jgi:hypothetical protein
MVHQDDGPRSMSSRRFVITKLCIRYRSATVALRSARSRPRALHTQPTSPHAGYLGTNVELISSTPETDGPTSARRAARGLEGPTNRQCRRQPTTALDPPQTQGASRQRGTSPVDILAASSVVEVARRVTLRRPTDRIPAMPRPRIERQRSRTFGGERRRAQARRACLGHTLARAMASRSARMRRRAPSLATSTSHH